MTNLIEFTSTDDLEQALAQEIAISLQQALAENGKASLAVSGGKTPARLFTLLADKPLNWSRINITLADERWTSTDSRDSNERLIRETLLQNRACAAHFIPLKQGSDLSSKTYDVIETHLKTSGAFPFDVLVLGMGEDGHTASLFPCSEEISQAMSETNTRLLTTITPKTAPYSRISFTLHALLQSHRIYLQLAGDRKLDVLKRAMAGDDVLEMPIRAFLQQPALDFSVYWAPG